VVVAAAAVDREEVIMAEVSRDILASVRDRMPVFAHRRAELYA
jgi:predicted amidohydrolase